MIPGRRAEESTVRGERLMLAAARVRKRERREERRGTGRLGATVSWARKRRDK